ncbi:MAG: sulfur carrier protein ThiS [Thermodesulfobacteriota bacterium]
MPIAIVVNGKPTWLEDKVCLSDFLAERGIDPNSVVVEHNLAIIPTEELSNKIINENDKLEILRFVGGG